MYSLFLDESLTYSGGIHSPGAASAMNPTRRTPDVSHNVKNDPRKLNLDRDPSNARLPQHVYRDEAAACVLQATRCTRRS